MLEQGFEPEFPDAVMREVNSLPEVPPEAGDASVQDLRHLLWSSIDNHDSRDLDQVEYAEALPDGTIRLLVAVADVDSMVPLGSAADAHAAKNTLSVYTGVVVFPMLPERLSTDLTSLNEGEDRLAMVVEMFVAKDGKVTRANVFRALVHNHAKLDYVTVGTWLEGGKAPPEIAANKQLEQQVSWHAAAADRLQQRRDRAGVLNFETVEARPVVADGKVVDITVVAMNRARDLIENFMVAANVAMATFLEDHDMPAIRRVVRTPRRWDRIVEIAAELGEKLPKEPSNKALAAFLERRKKVDEANFADLSMTVVKLLGAGEYVLDPRGDEDDDEGHFGLAVTEYTHSTAPNRRFPDLVVQRLAKSVLNGTEAPYTEAELHTIAQHCTKQEDAAKKVERTMRKTAAAELMQDRIGETFQAIVTGASEKGTYVRLTRPAVEGRVMQGAEGLDVGARVQVRLARVDTERGHIDFTHHHLRN
jgi:VacB/RNase II family 3'-5' exoribonuclease